MYRNALGVGNVRTCLSSPKARMRIVANLFTMPRPATILQRPARELPIVSIDRRSCSLLWPCDKQIHRLASSNRPTVMYPSCPRQRIMRQRMARRRRCRRNGVGKAEAPARRQLSRRGDDRDRRESSRAGTIRYDLVHPLFSFFFGPTLWCRQGCCSWSRRGRWRAPSGPLPAST